MLLLIIRLAINLYAYRIIWSSGLIAKNFMESFTAYPG